MFRHAPAVVTQLVFLERIATGVVLHGRGKIFLVFEMFPERETQVNAVLQRGGRSALRLDHLPLFRRSKPIGLQVGQAPVGVTEIGSGSVRHPVGFDGRRRVADGLQGVAAQQLQQVPVLYPFDHLIVYLQGGVVIAHGDTLVGIADPVFVIVRIFLQQSLRLPQRLGVFLTQIQHPDIVMAGEPVVRLELERAFEDELRVIQHARSNTHVRQQPHGLDMAWILFQKRTAQLLGPVMPAFGHHVSDRQQLARQSVQPLIPRGGILGGGGVMRLQQGGQRAPTGQQRIVQPDGVAESGQRGVRLIQGQPAMALLLESPAIVRPQLLKACQRIQGVGWTARVTLNYRQQIKRLVVFRFKRDRLVHALFRLRELLLL